MEAGTSSAADLNLLLETRAVNRACLAGLDYLAADLLCCSLLPSGVG